MGKKLLQLSMKISQYPWFQNSSLISPLIALLKLNIISIIVEK